MTMPAVLSAANEAAVGAFLNHRIGLTGIAETVERVMGKHKPFADPGLSDIMEAAAWASRTVEEVI